MGADVIIGLIAELLAKLGPLAIQAIEAERANDQATLDALKFQVVAMSNAFAPPGGDPPVVVP